MCVGYILYFMQGTILCKGLEHLRMLVGVGVVAVLEMIPRGYREATVLVLYQLQKMDLEFVYTCRIIK